MAAKRSSSGWKWTIIIVIVVAVVLGGVWYFKRGQDNPIQYQTAAVERGELTQAVTATGTLNPVVSVTVGSQVSGRISRLYVDYNSVVKSNEVIAEIDPSTYQATVEQVTADLSNAQANLELQQVQFKRSKELFEKKLISGSDYDTAVASLHAAEATVKIKQASLNNAMVNLGYCKIISPVDGVVISRAVELGQTVASSFNTPTLFQIANDLTKMQIDSSVSEADVGGVEEGQSVAFTVDAYPLRTFHGIVTQVRNSPTTVNNVVTYDCVIGVTNADYKLKPGMTANVSIVVADRSDALKIPNAALRFRPPDTALIAATETNAQPAQVAQTPPGGGEQSASGQRQRGQRGQRGQFGGGRAARQMRTIYVLGTNVNGKPELKPVQIRIGISDGLYTEVLDGLKEGDPVVTSSVSSSTESSSSGSNPFGGGFPRRR